MDERLIYFTAVLALGIAAQWLAWKWKLPSILLLLAFGFAAGQFYDQTEIIHQDTLFAMVSLAVAIILLEGGLTLRFSELKDSGSTVFRLVGPGALVTWVLSAIAARYLADFSWPVAILVAALLVVTGPTVIGPLLRTIKPQRSVNSILKWEGIVIDPVGAILAVLVFGVFFGHGHGGTGVEGVLLGLGKTILIGGGLGYLTALGLAYVLGRHWVPDYLQSAVVMAVGLVAFTLSNLLQHESGLLTVTVIGIGLANQHRAKIRHVIEFKEILRTVLISCLFIVLGGRIGIDDIMSVWKEALLFLAALIFVVRPAAVFISTIGTKQVTFREKIFLSFVAPRGIVAAAVSSVFALDLAEAQDGVFAAEAERIVPLAYTVIVGTVAFYGLLAGILARKLGLAMKNPQGVLFIGIGRLTIEAAKAIQEAGFRVLMIDTNYKATAAARMAGIPAVNANVLSDYAAEEIDLVGIGSMVAATPNDQVNTLACVSLGHTLGLSNVFQLKAADEDESERKSASTHYNGRVLGDRDLKSVELQRLEKQGAIVKCTTINEEFTFESFREMYGEKTVILFTLSASGELSVMSPDSPKPSKGDQVISIVNNDQTPVPDEKSPIADGSAELP